MAAWYGSRRKVFVTFFGDDEGEVAQFLGRWADREGVFIPKVLHASYSGTFVNSGNSDYVMGIIRRDFLGDSTVTLLLLGTCTHSRRYVDWELKASLRQGNTYIPNGLLAVSLPSAPQRLHLPPRFQDNWRPDGLGYAQWYNAPTQADHLGEWIETAIIARTTRSHVINNSQEMMRYNAKCSVCNVTHPAG